MRDNRFRVILQLNDEEHEKLKTLCRESGVNPTDMLRKLIMGSELRQRPSVDFAALNCSVDRLAGSLERIEEEVRQNNAIFCEDVQEAADIMYKIRCEMDVWKESWL